jgi:hypothetical protein
MQLEVVATPVALAAPELELLLLHAASATASAATPVMAASERRCREQRCSEPVMGRFLSDGPWLARQRHIQGI